MLTQLLTSGNPKNVGIRRSYKTNRIFCVFKKLIQLLWINDTAQTGITCVHSANKKPLHFCKGFQSRLNGSFYRDRDLKVLPNKCKTFFVDDISHSLVEA